MLELRALIHTHRTRTYIVFCDKTRVPMFNCLSIIRYFSDNTQYKYLEVDRKHTPH